MNDSSLYANLIDNSIVNINGNITNASDAKISIFDRGFLYGDSIYEVTYSENNSIIFLKEHIDRLFNSAKLLNMKIFTNRDEIIAQIMATAKKANIEAAYIRIILTRGETSITLDPNASFKNNLVIIVKPKPVHSKESYKNGIELFIPEVLRNDAKSVDPNAKSGNYLNNVMALAEAKKHGADDALMINHKGEITEGTTFNIWFVKNSTLYTPDLTSGLLRGITREKVIDICHQNDIDLKIQTISQDELNSLDEAFITSSTRGIMPVRKINDIKYGDNNTEWPVYQRIAQLYHDMIQKELSKQEYNYS